MSSYTRTLQRKRLRQGKFTTDDEGNTVRVEHEPKPQATFGLPDGGYVTVRYTRGPIRVSAARLRAQARLAEIQHPGEMREQARMFGRAIASAQQATENTKRLDELLAAPVHRVTRQMRRLTQRTGRPIPAVIGAAAVEKAKPARKPRAKKAAPAQQAA